MVPFHTFSIVARCLQTGRLGVAVSTAVPAVGGMCIYLAPRAGAIATQSWVNPYLGIDGLKALGDGEKAQVVLDRLLADDPGRHLRQVGIVDRDGDVAVHTGADCVDWAGHRTGHQFAVQGNMLVSAATVDAMAAAAQASAGQPLHERLMRAMEAGQRAGGDKRGKQSAALKIVDTEDYAWLDLRVDEHAEPVGELRRVLEVAKHQLIPFIEGMPTREDPLRNLPPSVSAMLLKPPTLRPGSGLGEG